MQSFVHHYRKDLLVKICRLVVQISLIILVAIILKFGFVDTIKVCTNHMNPTLIEGDRIVFLRFKFISGFRKIFKGNRLTSVLFRFPFTKTNGALRIAATSGDSIIIQNGSAYLKNVPSYIFPYSHKDTEYILPHDFSPRDNFAVYKVPQKGDTLKPHSEDLRQTIFLYSILTQENPKKNYHVEPRILLNDSVIVNYLITDFLFYTGKIGNIPDSLVQDWFFWNRLDAHIKEKKIAPKEAKLSLSIYENSTALTQYIVKCDYLFLLADNWLIGYDSRYFGPVCDRAIFGTIFGVLWSFDTNRKAQSKLRGKRVLKLIN